MIGPLLLVIVIHAFIIFTLNKQHEFRNFSDYKNITIATTVISVLLAGFFIKYLVDKFALIRLETLDALLVNEHKGFANLFVVLNSAVNPFVYFILLKDIRNTLIAAFRPEAVASLCSTLLLAFCCKRRKQGRQSEDCQVVGSTSAPEQSDLIES